MWPPRLGLRPHDPVRLSAAPGFGRHPLAAVPPLPRLDRSGIHFRPGVYENDRLPVCTCADIANAARAFSLATEGLDVSVSTESVKSLFCSATGCADTDAAITAEGGAVFLDVLGMARRKGFDVGLQAPLVPDFAVLTPGSLVQLAQATQRFGAAHIGIRLFDKDMAAISAGRVLDDDGSDPGPLSGRHMTFVWDYTGLSDADTWRLDAWGKWIPATGRFLRARTDEAYALAFRSLLGPDRAAYYPGMKAELSRL